MTIEEALLRLAESTADAVAKVLRTFAGEGIDRGTAVVVPAGQHPFAGIPIPSVIANVDYVDGITGGNVFVMSRAGAHRLAAAMMSIDEPCKLILLVPNAFVIRMTRALAELEADMLSDGLDHAGRQGLFSPELLRRIPVRVSVELGRARMSLAQAVGLPPGAVVELDRAADDPVDLFVNGKRYAEGRLVLLDGNEWGLRIERVLGAR